MSPARTSRPLMQDLVAGPSPLVTDNLPPMSQARTRTSLPAIETSLTAPLPSSRAGIHPFAPGIDTPVTGLSSSRGRTRQFTRGIDMSVAGFFPVSRAGTRPFTPGVDTPVAGLSSSRVRTPRPFTPIGSRPMTQSNSDQPMGSRETIRPEQLSFVSEGDEFSSYVSPVSSPPMVHIDAGYRIQEELPPVYQNYK